MRSLRKRPEERYESCAAFADELQSWTEQGQAGKGPGPRSAGPARGSRWPLWTAIIVAAAVALGIGGWLAWKSTDPAPVKLHDITK